MSEQHEPSRERFDASPPFFDWTNLHFRIGIYGSGAWLVVGLAILVFASNWNGGLKPNEWGDVFAGLFAPLAFLWLVLGFLQQGRELEAQIIELRKTVQHQDELVKETQKQVAIETRKEEVAQREREPNFLLAGSHRGRQSGMTQHEFVLTNEAGGAFNIVISVTPPLKQGQSTFKFPALKIGERRDFQLQIQEPLPPELRFDIQYVNVDGKNLSTPLVAMREGNAYPFSRAATP